MLPGISVHCVRACLNLWSYGFLHDGYAAVPFRFTREILCQKKQKFPLSLVLEQDSAFILFKEFIQVFVFRT